MKEQQVPVPQKKNENTSNVALAYLYIAVLMVAIAYFSYTAYSAGVLEPLEYYYHEYFSTRESHSAVTQINRVHEEPDEWFRQEHDRVYGSWKLYSSSSAADEVRNSGKLFREAYKLFTFVPLSGPTSSRSSMWQFIDQNTFSMMQLKHEIDQRGYAADISFYLCRITSGPVTLNDARDYLLQRRALPQYDDEALQTLTRVFDGFQFVLGRAEQLHSQKSISAQDLLNCFEKVSTMLSSSSSPYRQFPLSGNVQRVLYPFWELKALVSDLMKWLVEIKDYAHPIYVASLLLSNFNRLQPCESFENTERVSQLMASLLLMQSGYPPLAVHPDELSNYQSALRSSALLNSHRELVDLVIRHIAHQEQAFRQLQE